LGKQFDDLSKALARGLSRRQALQRMVGGVVAAAVALVLPGRTFAGGTSDCAHFCDAVFGDDTPEADACIADARHGTGACYEFGPRSTACEFVQCPPGEVCVSFNTNYGPGTGTCIPF